MELIDFQSTYPEVAITQALFDRYKALFTAIHREPAFWGDSYLLAQGLYIAHKAMVAAKPELGRSLRSVSEEVPDNYKSSFSFGDTGSVDQEGFSNTPYGQDFLALQESRTPAGFFLWVN